MTLAQFHRWDVAALTLLVLLEVTPWRAVAQELYGSVGGTVQDDSGGRVPGATIEIHNRDRNLVLSVVSNETGTYTSTTVLPGTDDVKVTLQGFREFVTRQGTVTACSISRVDGKMEVGQLSESVTVRSEVKLLKTDKPDTASAFTAKEVMELPLPEFRNYQSLLDLVPGSTPSEFQNAEIDTPARALSTNINGTNRNTNSTRVDGATNQFTWLPHHTLYVAPAETIAEVNVSTGSFSADQGLAGGAAVTVISKSGTNQLRGSGFRYYTNQDLPASSFFANRINAIAQRINDFYPLPNGAGNSSNYFKQYLNNFDRNQYDVKINWNRSPVHQIWGKIGVMDATVSNLQKLSFDGGGLGKTKTWVATVGQTFTPSRSFVIDTTVGYSLLDQWGYGPDYGTNYGVKLGVPGTNGPDIRQSGMPYWGNGMSPQGSTDSWNPYTRY